MNYIPENGIIRVKKKNSVAERISTSVRTVSTVLAPITTNKVRYFFRYKSFCHLKHPKTLSEKLLWIKLNVYTKSTLVKICGDKVDVRDYLINKGYSSILNKCYAIWSKSEDIDFSILPNQFVIKPNYGSKNVIICVDKSKTDASCLHKLCKNMLISNFWKDHRNFDGNAFNKRLICERYISDSFGNPPDDYKIYCFNGKPIAICCVTGRFSVEGRKEVFMFTDWTPISVTENTIIPTKPHCINDMLKIATDLCRPFPFVRVDLYEINNQVVFGELTFSPSSCVGVHEVPINGQPMGNFLNLPTNQEIDYLLNCYPQLKEIQ